MICHYYFTDENLKMGFKTNLDSHKNNHPNFILSNIPFSPDFGIETKYINKNLKEMATFYNRLKNQ